MHRQVRLVALLLAVAAPAAAEPVAPDHAEGKGWSVRATVVAAQHGQPARLEVRLAATGAFHLNDDYPINLVPAAAAGLTWAKARFERRDVVFAACDKDAAHRCAAALTAPFTATVPGRAGGTIAFSACDADQCVIEKIALGVPFSDGR